MPELLNAYLSQIGAQIRWRRARPALLQELEDHALAQLSDGLAAGLSEDEAAAEAIRQLGDPVEIGQQLDRLHRPRPQWLLLFLTGFLVLAGTVLQYFLLRPVHPVSLQKLLLFSAAGLSALLIGYFSNVRALIRWSLWLCCAAAAIGMGLLLFSGPYHTHFITLLFPPIFALTLCRLRGQGRAGGWLSLSAACSLLLVTLLSRWLPDLLVLSVTVSVLLLAAARMDWFRIGRRSVAPTMGVLLAMLLALGLLQASQGSFLRLFDTEYQALTIRSALAGAQLWGAGVMTGPWEGADFWRTVPNGTTDAFLVAVIHTYGWIPFILLLGLLLLLFAWILVKVIRRTGGSSRLLALSILFVFAVHLAGGLLLTFGRGSVGTFCPFLKMSAETVLEMGLMGLLLSVFRQETLPYCSENTLHRPSFRRSLS